MAASLGVMSLDVDARAVRLRAVPSISPGRAAGALGSGRDHDLHLGGQPQPAGQTAWHRIVFSSLQPVARGGHAVRAAGRLRRWRGLVLWLLYQRGSAARVIQARLGFAGPCPSPPIAIANDAGGSAPRICRASRRRDRPRCRSAIRRRSIDAKREGPGRTGPGRQARRAQRQLATGITHELNQLMLRRGAYAGRQQALNSEARRSADRRKLRIVCDLPTRWAASSSR